MIPFFHLSFVQCEQVKFRPKKNVKIKVCHNVVAVGTVGRGGGTVPCGAHLSSFAVLWFPDSKQVPIYCWADREFSTRRIAKPGFELTTFRRLSTSLPHNRVVLTTRSRHFSTE